MRLIVEKNHLLFIKRRMGKLLKQSHPSVYFEKEIN